MSKVVGNLNLVALRLSQQGEKAVKGVSQIMQDNAEKIRDLAIDYAPIDTGELEKAIIKNTEYTGINRRAVITVSIDESSPAGEYARQVHEWLEPFGTGQWGKVGGSDPNSLSAQKDGGRGVVGGKFLKRAYLFYKDKIRRDSKRVISKAFT